MLTLTEALMERLYHSYRHTSDIAQKGLFFSPTCIQICRPIPSYAATTREQIVQYLRDAQEGNVPIDSTTSKLQASTKSTNKAAEMTSDATEIAISTTSVDKHESSEEGTGLIIKSRSVYTIRPLHPAERHDFSTPPTTSSTNYTPTQLLQKSQVENWVGMRVDLWSEGVATDETLLVKVQYWWRMENIVPGEEMEDDDEGKGWRQCLHDIMYLGPKDGTEGENGLEVREL